jgi:DNA-binding GntR family transcriptional regulator
MPEPVDPTLYAPKYIQVADDIRRRIVSGEYQPGDRLRSAPDLADTYRVSVATVRKALTVLAVEHLIAAEQGVRAVVREMGERVVEELKRGEEAIIRPATADERRRLGLAAGAPVVVITGLDGTERIRDAYEIKLTAGDVTD